MKYFMTMTLTLLLAAGALFAQRPNNMGGSNVTTIMLKTDKGVFALRSGVLVKYDAITLKQIAEYQIFGAAPTMPERPADMTDQTAVQAWRTDMQTYNTTMQKRQGSALMIPTKDSLLIVIGDGFGRIDQDTLKPEAKASLLPVTPAADPNAPAATPVAPVRPTVEPVPGYVLDGNTLYLMRAKEVMSINITDGTIIARTALPVELQAAGQNNMFNPGGGRNGGGGAAGGGAGGGRTGGRNGGAGGGAAGGAKGGAAGGAQGGAVN